MVSTHATLCRLLKHLHNHFTLRSVTILIPDKSSQLNISGHFLIHKNTHRCLLSTVSTSFCRAVTIINFWRSYGGLPSWANQLWVHSVNCEACGCKATIVDLKHSVVYWPDTQTDYQNQNLNQSRRCAIASQVIFCRNQ